MHYSKNYTLKTLATLAMAATVIGCASRPQQASGEVLEATTTRLVPYFECVLLYDQLDKRELVTEGIDEASDIGEKNGLSPSQIMGAYGKAKKQARELVLEQAIVIASEDPDRVPRLDGTFPPPEEDDELQAWKDLYSPKCPEDGYSSST